MSENRRIAKNSIILYFKLIITTIIGLYATRLVLLELGANDYGLYAVVGGIVSMLGFLSTAMLASSYRYITVEIGKGKEGNVNKVFNTSLIIHIGLAVLFVIFAETIGVWYVNNYLNVEPERIPDALFVLHFTVLATVFSTVSVPFQGLIIAREKFLIRALIEIFKSILKLAFVLLLTVYLGNKLKAYAVIMAIVIIIPSLLFFMYVWIKEQEVVKWRLNKKWADYKDMISFSGWILIGTIAHMGVRQGAAIIINLFFGTLLNAAFGIATQIYNHIMMFVRNLNQAAVPQIMKSHSSGDHARSLALVYFISKYAFFIMLLPAIPIILSVDAILFLWLKDVPEFTKQFVILMIVNGLIGILGSGFDAAIQATGKIRKTQIWYSVIMLATLPVAYLLFYLQFPPYVITIVTIGATIMNISIQTRIISKLTEFKLTDYFFKTIKPAILVGGLILPQLFIRKAFGQGLFDVLIFSVISIILITISIYLVGLTRSEKDIIVKNLNKIRKK